MEKRRSIFDRLRDVVFDSGPAPSEQFLWCLDLGHVMVKDGQLFVLDGDEYIDATKDQVNKWNDLANELHNAQA